MPPEKVLYLLFCVLGVSAWVAINGVFQELPILAARQPEGWDIAVHLAATIQLANVFVVAESYVVRRFKVGIVQMTYILLATGIVAMALLAASWDVVGTVFGAPRSVALLSLTFLAGAVDCTTSVVYWPLVSMFPDVYTSALGVGEALSGTSVGLLGLVQYPAGASPNFSVSTFFLLLAGLTAVSLLAFVGIHRHYLPAVCYPTDQAEALYTASDEEDPKADAPVLARVAAPLAALAALNFLQNGVVTSLLSYAFLKYPEGNAWMSHYLVGYLIATPIPPAIAGVVRIPAYGVPLALCVIATAYMVWVAASPQPPLKGSERGGQVMMAVLLADQVVIGYLKTHLFYLLKAAVPLHQHRLVYKYGGYAIQGGSCAGAFLMLLLVSVFKVFSQ